MSPSIISTEIYFAQVLRGLDPAFRLNVGNESIFKWKRRIKLFVPNYITEYHNEDEIAECIRMQNPDLLKKEAGFFIRRVIDDRNGFGKIVILAVCDVFYSALERQDFRVTISHKVIVAETLKTATAK